MELNAMIYATNNFRATEELFLSELGAITLFWEHFGFRRRHARSQVRAGPL